MISNLVIWLAVMQEQRNYQTPSTWLQLVNLSVEEGQCDPSTAYHGVTNYVLHHWRGPTEPLAWLCREDQYWFEIPVNGGLAHTYHSLATGIWHGSPTILLNVIWTEERAPFILHSRDNDSRTVLFAAVSRQAQLATIHRLNPRHICDFSSDQLVTKLIKGGSDVHVLDSSGSTPLDHAFQHFVVYHEASPLKAMDFAHVARVKLEIGTKQLKNRVPGSQSGSEAKVYGSTDINWLFMQFLYWWFERLDDGGCNLNDYVRHENLQPTMCKIGRHGEVLGAHISKSLHYDETAQTLELDMKWTWTKIGGSEEVEELWHSTPVHLQG